MPFRGGPDALAEVLTGRVEFYFCPINTALPYIREGKLVDAKGSRARYVRLYSKGNNANELNHYVEVEVFGRPAK